MTFASNGAAPLPSRRPRRVCVLSVHTSPLEQPGTGDAGGMNVYVVETATRMARAGVAVEIFTRATSSEQPPVAALAPGVLVRHVAAGPFEGLGKNDLPSQLCAFTAGVLRAEARHEPGYYDVVHSHYWLSGQVGWLARDRWGVPLVHSAHTLARVKNAALAEGDEPEPMVRVIGEDQVVAEADRLIGNTDEEARQLVELYHADPRRTVTIPPGVDLARFRPGSRAAARAVLGLPRDAVVLAFVGRIQPLKAPDVLLRAAAELLRRDPALRERLVVLVAGGPSGTGLAEPTVVAGAGRGAGHRRRRALPAAAGRGPGRGLPRGRRRRRAQPQRVVRAGRAGGAGVRHPGRRGAGGRAAGRGGRRPVRAARPRPPRRASGPMRSPRRSADATSWARAPSPTPARSPGTAPPTPCSPPTPAPPTEFAQRQRVLAGLAS